jgi:hypothetical protein
MPITRQLVRSLPPLALVCAGTFACSTSAQTIAQLSERVARLEHGNTSVPAPVVCPAQTSPIAADTTGAPSPSQAVPGASDTFGGWFLAGTSAYAYHAVHDYDVKHVGMASARLEALQPVASGFGTLMQTVGADQFRGRRVRFSASVRTQDLKGWAGLWMRVDRGQEKAVAFDNMIDRPIRGTTQWTRHSIVLDVAPDASDISFGLLLDQSGKAWLDDASVEVVSQTVATTGRTPKAPQPINLDLEN